MCPVAGDTGGGAPDDVTMVGPSFGLPAGPARGTDMDVGCGKVVLLSPIFTHSVSPSSYFNKCSPLASSYCCTDPIYHWLFTGQKTRTFFPITQLEQNLVIGRERKKEKRQNVRQLVMWKNAENESQLPSRVAPCCWEHIAHLVGLHIGVLAVELVAENRFI